MPAKARNGLAPFRSTSRESFRSVPAKAARLSSWENTLERIKAHPLAGEGVLRGKDRLIEPTVPNTWLEITVEGGVFALIAFVWGLGATLYRWGGLRRENRAVGIVLLLYFLVSWQFIQTFPRLDQWLSLWMALMALRAEPRNAAKPVPEADHVRCRTQSMK